MVIVFLMFMLSSVIVLARERYKEALDIDFVKIKKWGGWVLASVGVWLAALGVWADFFAGFFPV